MSIDTKSIEHYLRRMPRDNDAAMFDAAADRLAELEEQLYLANIDALQTEAERNELASELRQAMDERDAAQAEVRELRAELARVREEARKEVEQLAASEKTCRRIANEKTLEAMELRQQLAAAKAERKRNGWCIWSPWSGCLSSTFAGTRTECIKVFERDIGSPWRRYREQGFECRPVLLVDARK